MITVMNADGGGLSEYSLAANGVAAVSNQLYFSTAAALLGAGTETITASVKTGWFSPGELMKDKRVDRVRFVLDTKDTIVVYIGVRNYTGETTHGPFSVPAVNDAIPSSRVLRVPRWLKGQYWQFEIRNVSGGGLELKEVSLEAEQLAQVRGG